MISEKELAQFEHLAKHSLHLRKEASELVARLIAEVRSLRPLPPIANAFFYVGGELLQELFALPDEIRVVGFELDYQRSQFRVLVKDIGFPDDEPAVEYRLIYERVPMDRRLKNIARVAEVVRPEA